jgi:hypothetical protein
VQPGRDRFDPLLLESHEKLDRIERRPLPTVKNGGLMKGEYEKVFTRPCFVPEVAGMHE